MKREIVRLIMDFNIFWLFKKSIRLCMLVRTWVGYVLWLRSKVKGIIYGRVRGGRFVFLI